MTEQQPKPEGRIVNLTRTHTIMWYCLLVWVMITSMVAGTVFGPLEFITPGVALFILLGNAVLGATMAAISRRKEL